MVTKKISAGGLVGNVPIAQNYAIIPSLYASSKIQEIQDSTGHIAVSGSVGLGLSTLYAVPGGYTFYITAMTLQVQGAAAAAGEGQIVLIDTATSGIIKTYMRMRVGAAAIVGGSTAQSLVFTFPLKIDGNTTLSLRGTNASIESTGTLIGFLIPLSVKLTN